MFDSKRSVHFGLTGYFIVIILDMHLSIRYIHVIINIFTRGLFEF